MPAVTLTKRLVKGSPLTNVEVDANWDTLLSYMNGVLLPQTAHDLNDYDTPGVYGQNATAGAVAGSNYPVDATAGSPVAGILKVWKGATGGNVAAHQEYRTYYQNLSTIFYRNKVGTNWGNWLRIAKWDEAMTHTYLTAATDCNTLTADNMFYTFNTGTVMTGGTNWPPAGTNIIGGSVEVMWYAATRAVQTVTLIVGGLKPRIFVRDGNPTTSVWNAWRMIGSVSSTAWLPTADCGDVYVDGIGWHAWNGSAYARTDLAAILPTAAHDLNTYTLPGDWYQGTTSSATVANNYPEGAALGFLAVKAYGTAVVQEYTTRASSSRKWWRAQVSAGTWSPWYESANTLQAMTHVILTAATDANTMVLDNTFYTWTSSGFIGANFPTFTTNWAAAGYMRVYWNAATQVCQEVTFIVGGQKPRSFARFGNASTGVWQPWKSTSDWSSNVGLPNTDCGDIYVDGAGTYRWSGSAYALSELSYTTMTDIRTRLTTVEGQILGRGQVWTDVSALRAGGVYYTNSTARPIIINIRGTPTAACTILVADGAFVQARHGWPADYAGQEVALQAIIPPGHNYTADWANFSAILWYEFR